MATLLRCHQLWNTHFSFSFTRNTWRKGSAWSTRFTRHTRVPWAKRGKRRQRSSRFSWNWLSRVSWWEGIYTPRDLIVLSLLSILSEKMPLAFKLCNLYFLLCSFKYLMRNLNGVYLHRFRCILFGGTIVFSIHIYSVSLAHTKFTLLEIWGRGRTFKNIKEIKWKGLPANRVNRCTEIQ